MALLISIRNKPSILLTPLNYVTIIIDKVASWVTHMKGGKFNPTVLKDSWGNTCFSYRKGIPPINLHMRVNYVQFFLSKLFFIGARALATQPFSWLSCVNLRIGICINEIFVLFITLNRYSSLKIETKLFNELCAWIL